MSMTRNGNNMEIIYERQGEYMLADDESLENYKPEPGETCWLVPESMGIGSFHKITIRSGFELWITDCVYHEDTLFRHRDIPHLLQFNFVQSGHYKLRYDHSVTFDEYEGEQQGIYLINSPHSTCLVKGQVPIRAVSVVVFPEFFLLYQGDQPSELPSSLNNLVHNESATSPVLTSHKFFSMQVRETIQQIKDCRENGISRKLFLESKALELIFLQMERIAGVNRQYTSVSMLHPQDEKMTEQARERLLSNLEEPPCLCDLARSVGMSHPKLNRCFKQMYGKTVFQCLRYERLNKAKELLEEQRISVTETAFQVGYDSLSHFSQAYKKQFGVLPSNYRKVA